MRFSLLCASAALAASLVLSGCSTSGSSSAIPGGSSATSAGHHVQLHMVITGPHQAYTCSGSGLYACYLVNNGKTDFEWCIVDVTSGNCTSNLAPGKWKWSNTAPIAGRPQTEDLSTGMPTGKVKSVWCHTVGTVVCSSGSVANPAENEIRVKATVKYTNGKPGYQFSWQACAKSGPYKGSCVAPPGAIGIIVGNY